MKKFLFIIFLIIIPSLVLARDVTIEWDHDGINTDGFKIYRGYSIDHQWPELMGNVNWSQRSFIDTSVPNGDFRWVITAYNSNGESDASAEVRYAYYFPRVKYEYDQYGRIIYKGENANYTAVDSDTTWIITKYSYDGSGNVTESRVRTTSWTNRSSGW